MIRAQLFSPKLFSKEAANAIFTILVEHAGAQEDQRELFVWAITLNEAREYRFQGLLGFGGKVYWTTTTAPHISCYEEERTPARVAVIADVNARLEVFLPTE